MLMKYYGRDPVSGSIRLSRKALTVGSAKALKQLKRGSKVESNQESKYEKEFKSSHDTSSLNQRSTNKLR